MSLRRAAGGAGTASSPTVFEHCGVGAAVGPENSSDNGSRTPAVRLSEVVQKSMHRPSNTSSRFQSLKEGRMENDLR